ncbi:MAG: hypothetical protein KY434_04320 [Actinobacteria bacterium]|nr:hypothetical protein [Actinomycetota bacterium]
MNGPRQRPVPPGRVVLAGVALLAALAAVGGLVESLRRPSPGGVPEVAEPPSDPRAQVSCPPAREDEARGRSGDARPPRLVTSSELFDCPGRHDGRRVRYRGEVVGAVLEREGGAWVQLNDDAYAGELGPLPAHRDYRGGNAGIGVWLPAELAGRIHHVGGPRFRGDVLDVVGRFHRVDAATGEVVIVRAEHGSVARRGKAFVEPFRADRGVAALLLGALAAVAVVTERRVGRTR